MLSSLLLALGHTTARHAAHTGVLAPGTEADEPISRRVCGRHDGRCSACLAATWPTIGSNEPCSFCYLEAASRDHDPALLSEVAGMCFDGGLVDEERLAACEAAGGQVLYDPNVLGAEECNAGAARRQCRLHDFDCALCVAGGGLFVE